MEPQFLKVLGNEPTFTDTLVRLGKSQIVVYKFALAILYVHYYKQLALPYPIFAGILAALSGVAFLACGKIVSMSGPTRKHGLCLLQRVSDARENWERYTLRSFMECGWWLAVTWYTYVISQSTILAFVLGGICGMIVAVVGEVCQKTFHANVTVKSTETSKWARPEWYQGILTSLPITFVFGYLVLGVIQTIFLYHKNIVTGCALATLAGIAFTLCGEIFLSYQSTRNSGIIILSRVTNAGRNWRVHPLRSSVELFVWLSVIYGSYSFHQEVIPAVRLGTVVGLMSVIANSHFFPCNTNHASHNCHELSLSNKKTALCPGEPIKLSRNQMKFTDWQKAKQAQRNIHKETTVDTQKNANHSRNRVIKLAEVAKHNEKDDCWIIIHDKVYDVSRFYKNHPGGDVILKFGGTDATDQFESFHTPTLNIKDRMKRFQIGYVEDNIPVLPCTQDFRDLREYLREHGYFKADPVYFAMKNAIVLLIGMTLVGLVSLAKHTYYTANPMVSVAVATVAGVCLALFWHQSAFIAHDTLHNGVLAQRKNGAFNWLGFIHGTLIFGISTEKWLNEHNGHHAYTLRPEEDPQFLYLPLWLQNKKEMLVSQFFTKKSNVPAHEDESTKKDWKGDQPIKVTDYSCAPWVRMLISVQQYTLFPVAMIVGRINYYILSFVYAISHGSVSDLVGMGIFWSWYLKLLGELPTLQLKLIFFITSNLVIGVLHVQLMISHLGTDMFFKEEEPHLQFFQTQTRTSRNIDSDYRDHWFHGGLEFQIEHHLFPQLPRHNLSKIKPVIMDMCNKHALPYRSTGFFSAIQTCVDNFGEVANELLYPELG